jgi:hypothetical protein
MSMIKRWMEEQEQQEGVATGIAVEAGVLKQCEAHGEVYDVSLGDHSSAYALGNWKFTNKKVPEGLYSDRKELNDAIQKAIKNSGMECGYCAKHRDE